MQFLLLTTTDMRSSRAAEFANMISTVADNVEAGAEVLHIVLLQRCSEAEREAFAASMPYRSEVLCCADRMPLSAARNAMLEHIRQKGFLSARALVSFPDDDCWYLPGVLPVISDAFEASPDLGLLIADISPRPFSSWPATAVRVARTADVLRRSCSIGMFVRSDVAAQIGAFDSNLGLGTPNGSGEDTDFALRAWFAAPRTLYVNRPLVGHQDADPDQKMRYFRGNMIVAGRYAFRSPGLFYEFARKLSVGVYMVARNRLRVGDFVHAAALGFDALRRRTARG